MILRSKPAATKKSASPKLLDTVVEASKDAASKGERFTPEELLCLVRTLAPIKLDPCTTPNNPTGARFFYTASDDGLSKVWRADGLVWCNPPFGRGDLARWVDKVIKEATRVPDREILLLTPGDLGTRWAQALYGAAQAIAFIHGRLSFARPDGSYDQGAKQPSAVWYFGERSGRFHRVFESHASVMHLGRPHVVQAT